MLMDSAMEYLNARKIAFADRFMPYYIASSACHIMNLENKSRQFYLESGTLPDLRVQMFLVSPPGFMKSFFLKILLQTPTSLLGGTVVKTAYQGSLSEAGFVGTIRFGSEDEPVTSFGAAAEYSDYIVGIEEFNALTNAMKQEHSTNLDNALLTALDSGRLVKRLGAGEIKYDTNITLFSGSQPARFNLSSGLGRRFVFIYFIPNAKEKEKLKIARREGRGVSGRPEVLKQVIKDVAYIEDRCKYVKEFEFSSRFTNFLDTLGVTHFVEPLYERLGLGFTLSTKTIDTIVKVDLNEELKRFLQDAHVWRQEIARGAEEGQIVKVLMDENPISDHNLKEKLLDFGLTYLKSEELLQILIKQKRVKRNEGKIELVK